MQSSIFPKELQSPVKQGIVSKAIREQSCFADLAGDVYPSGWEMLET